MLALLKKSWWKYIGVVLLMYVLIGGMLVPLGPGITKVNPDHLPADIPLKIELTGYNTHFLSGGNLQVFFKEGANYFKPDDVSVLSETTLMVPFTMNSTQFHYASVPALDVIVNDDLDGNVTLREGLVLSKETIDTARNGAEAKAITPEVKHNKFQSFAFPYREILYQSIRNTFYHVPMWFGMLLILLISVAFSIRFLMNENPIDDIIASEAVNVGLLYGVLGLLTGMMWATFTWGEPWPNDPKLNGAAMGVMIYFAYVILRGSMDDAVKRARISAVYNIFAVVFFVAFIFIVPRLTDSLHPGNGGNPAFSKYDLDSRLRLFFYPAVIGWGILSFWILSIRVRIKMLERKIIA
ncbi:MAG: cytochrome c biogenesis protein CcsA [Chitinophagales bacterium]